jgi:predicted PhzF superfamily epimerase YddE/YHI9
MPVHCNPPTAIIEGVNLQPQHIYKSRDYVLVYKNEEEVRKFVPDFEWLNKIDTLGIIVTAKGNDCDFVSRFFVPNSVIGEDPVTGSAHATLIPYWSKELNKTTMIAKQISRRGGLLFCEAQGNRVTIAGKAVLYMKGQYFI